jgi:hypothetical protein
MRIFDVPDNIDFAEWTGKLQLGMVAASKGVWMLATALAHRHADTDEGMAVIVQCQKEYHYSDQTLLNLKSLGKHFPVGRRDEALSLSHHQALIPIAINQPKRLPELMREAREADWSVSELRKHLKEEGSVGGSTKPSANGPSGGEQPQDTEAAAAYQAIDHHWKDFMQARKDGAAPKDVNYELTRLYDAIADHLGLPHAE